MMASAIPPSTINTNSFFSNKNASSICHYHSDTTLVWYTIFKSSGTVGHFVAWLPDKPLLWSSFYQHYTNLRNTHSAVRSNLTHTLHYAFLLSSPPSLIPHPFSFLTFCPRQLFLSDGFSIPDTQPPCPSEFWRAFERMRQPEQNIFFISCWDLVA